MHFKQLKELLLQSLEHERGGVKVYETALECVQNDALEDEWTRYQEEAEQHLMHLKDVCRAMGIDPAQRSVGRDIAKGLAHTLVHAMKSALTAGDRDAAQLVACECVVLAQTKDHLDWELLAAFATKYSGHGADELKRAIEEVEGQKDEHFHHSKGWCRELWLKSLGLMAVLPPPEERDNVKIAIGVAHGEQARAKMR